MDPLLLHISVRVEHMFGCNRFSDIFMLLQEIWRNFEERRGEIASEIEKRNVVVHIFEIRHSPPNHTHIRVKPHRYRIRFRITAKSKYWRESR